MTDLRDNVVWNSGSITPLVIVIPRVKSVKLRENPAFHQDRGWEAEDVTTPEWEGRMTRTTAKYCNLVRFVWGNWLKSP